MPAFVTELDRDKATIVLVDSNLHREYLLPSEKAFAYKMKVEAMNRQGERTDLTSSQVGKRLNTYDVIAEESGESRNQIHRYIRLTKLLPKLLEYVDEGRINRKRGLHSVIITGGAYEKIKSAGASCR